MPYELAGTAGGQDCRCLVKGDYTLDIALAGSLEEQAAEVIWLPCFAMIGGAIHKRGRVYNPEGCAQGEQQRIDAFHTGLAESAPHFVLLRRLRASPNLSAHGLSGVGSSATRSLLVRS